MHIGIIEISPAGHVTLLECVAKIYLSDARNQLTIISLQKNIAGIKASLPAQNITLIAIEESDSIEDTMSNINTLNLDLAYFITFEKLDFLPAFAKTHFHFPIRLFIHNIDFWFEVTFFERIKKFIKLAITNKNYSLKDNFLNHFYHFPFTKKVIANVMKSNGKLVVLNQLLKTNLNQYVSASDTMVIPFSFRDKSLIDLSLSNEKISICLPGFVTQNRRDYLGLLKGIEDNFDFFQKHITIDLLGGIRPEIDSSVPLIAQKAKELIQKGIDIKIYEKPNVAIREFDAQLQKADFILANLNNQLGYGKTKESGIPFTMIKAAKPGIFQEGYPTLPELNDITLYFKDYNNFVKIMAAHIENKEKLTLLKHYAVQITENFTPENLYKSV
jgi:hypothetical protein